jgi:pyruvate dehydrogenase E1 component alpha subunit
MRDAGYRTQEEVDQWKLRDPIKLWEARLLETGVATQEEISQLEAEVSKKAEEAAQYARQSPMPTPSTVMDHLFSQEV